MAARPQPEIRFTQDGAQTRRLALKAGLFFAMLCVGFVLDAALAGRLSLDYLFETLSVVIGFAIVFFVLAGVGLLVLPPLIRLSRAAAGRWIHFLRKRIRATRQSPGRKSRSHPAQ